METLAFSFNEKTALTLDNGLLEFWAASDYSSGKKQIFQNSKGKLILSSDCGYEWKHEAKKAEFCEYHQHWMGEFPYGSWCWAIRKCLVTGAVTVTTLETEINPRGATQCDRWVAECKSYVPDSVPAA